MTKLAPVPATPFFMLTKEEQHLHTEELRKKLARAVAYFVVLDDNRMAPDTTFGVNGQKVPTWYLTWTGYDAHEGGAGWRIYVDALGNLYKGPFRRPITKFTRLQMERMLEEIGNKLSKQYSKTYAAELLAA